jgi:hypothetical protein
MNMTHIATSSLLLTMGVFSAIAVIGMQTGVLARPVPSLDVTAQSEDEINDKNWQKHPTIIAIRKASHQNKPNEIAAMPGSQKQRRST